MKKVVFVLGILFLIACKKSEVAVTPPVVVVPEEAVKFSTNLDTGTYYVSDTLPLIITVSTKVPAAGFIYSVTTTWTDSSKQIFKLDTTITAASLSLNIPGHKRMGNYSVQVNVSSKATSTNTSAKTIPLINIPYVSAINVDMDKNLNWNDHAQGKNGTYDVNKDGIPDIITWTGNSNNPKINPTLIVKDYLGKDIFTFNIRDKNSKIRDSLNRLLFDYRDLNKDGYLDFALTYMGEWDFGNSSGSSKIKFYGVNTYLLISKGNLDYDVIEILDIPNQSQFNINIFDWDFDGLQDLLVSGMSEGIYYKNMGNNKFEKKTLAPLFKQGNYNKYDYDKDGNLDFVNFYTRQKDEFGNYSSSDNTPMLNIVTSKSVINMNIVGKTIEKYVYPTNNTTSSERISLLDGDGDGDMDLIIGSFTIENNIQSYLQDYFENTGSQFVYKKDFIEIDKSLIGELQVWSEDIDRDGDLDLYYPTYSKSRLGTPKWTYFWWENTKTGFKINKKFRLKY
jgi:hypothetical protein